MEVERITGVKDPALLTEEHARKYRDHQLDTVSPNTTKTRIRSIRALYEVAWAETWISKNPFDAVKLRFIKGQAKRKEVVRLDHIDKKVREGAMPIDHTRVYWIARLTGAHISEASGIQYRDLDLENDVITIQGNELRPLKNSFREREIPMLDELKQALSGIDVSAHKPDEHVFPQMYNHNTKRWGYGLQWDRRIGVTPKACRDCVATTLRDCDVNERVIGAILGHTPKTSTGLYGAVSMEAKLKALNYLTNE